MQVKSIGLCQGIGFGITEAAEPLQKAADETLKSSQDSCIRSYRANEIWEALYCYNVSTKGEKVIDTEDRKLLRRIQKRFCDALDKGQCFMDKKIVVFESIISTATRLLIRGKDIDKKELAQ